MDTFLILPNQLFRKNHLNKKYKYVIWEHPHYFKSYNYNKKKLILHFGSMKYYHMYLKHNNYNVRYVKLTDKPKLTEYFIWDPIDRIKLPGKPTIVESPNFLLTKEIYAKYREKTTKFFFNAFYMWGKKQIDLIPNIKSLDKENRKSIPKNIKIPSVPTNKADEFFIKKGIKYTNDNFPKNYGNTDNFIFPLTHKTARQFLKHFIKTKFNLFGDYQDAIIQGENYLFHSLLASSINIGLLNPNDVVEEIMKYKTKIKMNNLEGFIRQLFWREYQRYCYIYYNFENKNYFGNTKKLGKDWYEGTTNITIIDDCIKSAFDTGYLHHINRLMVVGNYMNLSGINPKEGFKWFMEFSCDSYEWVMHQNVLEMVFFVSGGDTMRRPYVSSSNYILKMSNYKKGDWCDIWDDKYNKFLKKNKNKLWKFRYYFRGLKN